MTRYRRPWYWLVVLFGAACAVTWLIAANARSRIAQNERSFESAQLLRLERIEQSIDAYFADAIQLAAAGAEMVAPRRADPALERRLVLGLYRARRNDMVYGLGAFYAPYAFDGKTFLFSMYDHGPLRDGIGSPIVPTRSDHYLPGHILQIVEKIDGSDKAEDYTKRNWYRQAVETPDETVFVGPYDEQGHSFISTLKAFYRSGRLAGVISVDTLTVSFKSLLRAQLVNGDVAYLESYKRGQVILGTAPLAQNREGLVDRDLPMRYSRARVHLVSDAQGMRAGNRRLAQSSLALVGILWIGAGLFGMGIVRTWRARDTALQMESERTRLENEIAVGKRVEGELRKAARTDALTGLPNRAAFLEDASLAIAATGDEPSYAVFFVDLDRFNMVNDTLGHLAGDELLKAIARRLRDALPEGAHLSRLGGDEFVVCAALDAFGVEAIAGGILACLHEPMSLGERALYTSASIGIAVVDPTYREPEDLLRDADIAMYAAKQRGRGCFAIFDTAMRSKVRAEAELENDLRGAIERREFVPYYQPIVEIETGLVASFEALVRWNRPGRGVVPAAEFIGYAETHGLVGPIDDSMMEDVCRDGLTLFQRFPDSTLGINISAAHLTAPGLADDIERALRLHAIAPARVNLEITETAIMTDADQARSTLDRLHRAGIQIVLDDFGAGHSSLAYLHRLPIAGLKIDRSFVTSLGADEQADAIVRSIVALASTLRLYTVAEGVETGEQLSILRRLGVKYAQGFYFSPPLALAALLLQYPAQSQG